MSIGQAVKQRIGQFQTPEIFENHDGPQCDQGPNNISKTKIQMLTNDLPPQHTDGRQNEDQWGPRELQMHTIIHTRYQKIRTIQRDQLREQTLRAEIALRRISLGSPVIIYQWHLARVGPGFLFLTRPPGMIVIK